MTETGWKWLDQDADGTLRSRSGHHEWTIGEWYHVDGRVQACERGFHCSPGIADAWSYVSGRVLARVEARGGSNWEGDKTAWSDMRIVQAWRLTPRLAVEVAVHAAELVLDIFEQKRPGDDRPRKAIQAAKDWMAAAAPAAAAAAARAKLRAAIDEWFTAHLDQLETVPA